MTNTEIKEIQILQKREMGPQKISDITKLPSLTDSQWYIFSEEEHHLYIFHL